MFQLDFQKILNLIFNQITFQLLRDTDNLELNYNSQNISPKVGIILWNEITTKKDVFVKVPGSSQSPFVAIGQKMNLVVSKMCGRWTHWLQKERQWWWRKNLFILKHLAYCQTKLGLVREKLQRYKQEEVGLFSMNNSPPSKIISPQG